MASVSTPGERNTGGTVIAFLFHRSKEERPMSRTSRRVVVASGDSERAELLDALLYGESEFDTVVVDSIAGAYSRVKKTDPDLIIVLMEIGDVEACQLLSMLAMDRHTRAIPVETCVMDGRPNEVKHDMPDLSRDWPSQVTAVQMN